MSACVTLEEVLAAAHARCASLVPETSGYLALAVSDATSRLPLRLDDRAVLLTTEGTVTARSRGEPVAPAEAARLLRDLLARLLAASAGSMPNLAATARPRPASEQDPDAVARELEAALIPVNRNAARRALARLARETLRAKEAGRLKRARAEVQARPAAPEANEEAPPPARSRHEPRAEAAAWPRDQAAAMCSDAAPPARAVVELTLSPGPVAPAVVELTLSPGLVACETAGLALPASAIAGEVTGTAAVEPPPEHAARAGEQPEPPTHAGAQTDAVPPSTHAGAQAEHHPDPTPTVVEAVVELEAAGAPAEIPVIPELIEPARSIAPVAPIVSSRPIAPAMAAVAPDETRAVAASSPEACASAYGEALTSPEGLEVLLVDFSPAPAIVAPPSREPTPTESILVDFSPDPVGVVSQEPTPTVAAAVWAEMVAAEGAAAEGAAADRLAEAPAGVAEAPAGVAEAPAGVAEAVETARAPAIHYRVAEEAALQVTPAYGGWPLVRREHLGAVLAGARAAVASLEETPEARHTLPWPLPAQRGDDALAAPAEASLAVEADASMSAPDALPPADVAPAEPSVGAASTEAAPAEPSVDAASTEAAPAEPSVGAASMDAAPAEPSADAASTEAAPAEPSVDAASTEAAPAEPSVGAASMDAAPAEPSADAASTEAAPAEPSVDAASTEAAPAEPSADAAPAEPSADAVSAEPSADATPAEPSADAVSAEPSADATPAEPSADAAPAEEPCPPDLGPIDAIVWSASRRSRSARPPADGGGAGASRVDELVARFVAQSEHSAQRRAARSMKALAGLDLTLTPPPVAALSASSALGIPGVRAPISGPGCSAPSERAVPEAERAALDAGSREPAPLVTPRRRGLSLWLALVALALLFAGLAGTLRPELFASLAEPLARGALHAVPRAEARTPPPHD
ncbi:hypothetical protein [Sorangium sp. So ce1078]|uniref:hypothetical protein n=1 Tax=Sorangium sp. So ce1078 TaxID=3133329 RepID=UPI003F63B5B5